MSESMHEQSMQIIREEYSALDEGGEVFVDPALVAARAMARIDPDGATPVMPSYLAVLQLRQMAREVCRKVSGLPDPGEVGQQQLFDGQLQRRYPVKRNGKDGYVLREQLNLSERREINARIFAIGDAWITHGRAFAAETDALIAAGVLHDETLAA